jgi:hypothetical protein
MKPVEFKDASRIDGEPSEHDIRGGPRKDAVRVSVEQPVGREFAADANESVFVGVIGMNKKSGHLLMSRKEKVERRKIRY